MSLERKMKRQYGSRERTVKKGTVGRRVKELKHFPDGTPVPNDLEHSLHATKGYRTVRIQP